MDKQVITSTLNNMSNLSSISSSELETLLGQYPYFEIGQVLLAKKYQNEKHLAFDHQLQKAAIYASDRSSLFELMSRSGEVELITEPVATESKIEVEQAIAELENEVNPIASVSVSEDELEQVQAQVQAQEEVDRAPVEDAIEEIPEVTAVDEVSIEPELAQKESALIEEVAEVEDVQLPEATEEVAQENTMAIENESEEDHSFLDWLHVLDKKTTLKDGKSKTKAIAEKKQIIEIEPNIDYLSSSEPSTLDDFLERNISRKPDEPEEVSVSELAKHSVEPDEDIVSETLAQLLVLQKKYDHATQMYQKLGLKYPEKSSYFAIRIEEIKKLR